LPDAKARGGCGLISTQLLHIADVSGSGISCSHGRWASDPSRKALDEVREEMKRILLRVAIELRLRERKRRVLAWLWRRQP